MFAYCGNNPVNYADAQGTSWSSFMYKLVLAYAAVKYASKVAKSVLDFVQKISKDYSAFSQNNTDVESVYNSNYFSSYNGKLVIRHSSNVLTSWSIGNTIFLNHSGDKRDSFYKSQLLNHEYGHLLQEDDFGTVGYIGRVFIPSATYNVISRCNDWLNANYYNMPWEYDADCRANVYRDSHSSWAGYVAAFYFVFVG